VFRLEEESGDRVLRDSGRERLPRRTAVATAEYAVVRSKIERARIERADDNTGAGDAVEESAGRAIRPRRTCVETTAEAFERSCIDACLVARIDGQAGDEPDPGSLHVERMPCSTFVQAA